MERVKQFKILRCTLAFLLAFCMWPSAKIAHADESASSVSNESTSAKVSAVSNDVIETNQATINEVTAQKTTFPVHTIKKNVDDDKAFVLLILGDGFTKDEQTKFLEAAQARAKVLLSIDPYRQWGNNINIYAMCVESNESGTTYFGTKKDTYFGIDGSYYKFRTDTPTGSTQTYPERAVALRTEVENNVLSSSSNFRPKVSTTHIIYNSNSADEVESSGISSEIDDSLNISISPMASQPQSKA